MIFLGIAMSCNKNFQELNTDANSATLSSYNQNSSLSKAQLEYAGNSDFSYETWRVNIIYSSLMMQHLANNSWYSGDKYIENLGWQSSYFDVAFRDQLKYATDIIINTKGKPNLVTLYNAARIMRVLIAHRLTDIYGDIPYSDAGFGSLGDAKYLNPKYDNQAEIYPDMLKQLDSAQTEITTGTDKLTNDLIYKGDVSLWKKFANSLMLRLAMRLVKVDVANAQKWAEKAVANGAFSSNDDNALIKHDASGGRATVNRINNILGNEWDATGMKTKGKQDILLSQTFVDFLKNNNDPRLGIIAVLRNNNDKTPANQIGMPNGYDNGTTIKPITGAPNYPGEADDTRNGTTDKVYKYSTINSDLLGLSAPTCVISYAEVALLKAEMAVKGWNNGGVSAQVAYDNGVKASMKQFAQYNSASTVADADITTYLTASGKKWDAANGLTLINEQYWVATFFNWYETWANWRRTGIPALTPVNYTGNATGGTIPRRMTYPATEASDNKANFNTAVSRLSNGNTMTSRVWWDK